MTTFGSAGSQETNHRRYGQVSRIILKISHSVIRALLSAVTVIFIARHKGMTREFEIEPTGPCLFVSKISASIFCKSCWRSGVLSLCESINWYLIGFLVPHSYIYIVVQTMSRNGCECTSPASLIDCIAANPIWVVSYLTTYHAPKIL